MSTLPTFSHPRRQCRQVKVGDVLVGADAPIAVQSMTNTDTLDVKATCEQVNALQLAGADIVRVSVPSLDHVSAFRQICQQTTVPLVADIHFDYRVAVAIADSGVSCLRINPGNIGREERVREVIQAAKDNGLPIRIGVNAGSLEKDLQKKYGEPNADALVESAMRHIDKCLAHDFENFKVSIKASNVPLTVASYRLLAERTDAPLHLGITEAGSFRSGTVKSSLGIGMLLYEGIGDTIRVSLAADPVLEVKVAWDLLKALNLRSRGVNIIACPSCSRQNFDVISVVNAVEQRLDDITQSIDLAIIGCYVNGPGESKEAQIGITGAAKGNLLYINGQTQHKISENDLVDEIETQVRTYLERQQRAESEKVELVEVEE